MENKHVGYLILGISVVVIIVILLFNSALKDIVTLSCGVDHEEFCPMAQTVNEQTYIALGVVGLLILVGLLLIFSKPNERIIVKTKTVQAKKKPLDLSGLDKDEKAVVKLLEEENGTIFQAEMKEKLDIGKVKLTRLLDKLEAKEIIERKRRGMNNVVVIRD